MGAGADSPGRRRGWLRWALVPFALAWRAASLVERHLGLLPLLLLGLGFFVLGMLLNLTLAGMLLGIPATLLGSLLLLRALY